MEDFSCLKDCEKTEFKSTLVPKKDEPLDITVQVNGIADATDIGKSLLKADSQSKAREVIGAGTSNFDGNYNSLTNKPTIPTTATKDKAGTVKQCVLVASASGETVTKAEFEALLTALKSAGIMANS